MQALQPLGECDPSLLYLTLSPAAGTAGGRRHSAEVVSRASGRCRAAETAGSGAGLGGPEAADGAAQGPTEAGTPPGPLPHSGEGPFPLGCVCGLHFARACAHEALQLWRESKCGHKVEEHGHV